MDNRMFTKTRTGLRGILDGFRKESAEVAADASPFERFCASLNEDWNRKLSRGEFPSWITRKVQR